MIHFDEIDFLAYLKTVNDVSLFKGLLSVREMLNVDFLLYSPLDDVLMAMEDCYHREIFFRFVNLVEDRSNDSE